MDDGQGRAETNADGGGRGFVPGFDASDFARASGADLLGSGPGRFARVVTDSREAADGDLFAALPGERTDGHAFLSAAMAAGAKVLLVSRAYAAREGDAFRSALAARGVRAVAADDALAALQAAAAAYRARFPGLPRVGVTGSAGKTTTKECVYAVLSRFMRVAKNPGNFNSDIGLPQSMFLLRPEHEAAVFEMGINRPGEMDVLSRVYAPTSAVITNVGTAHIGILGSRDAIADEKRKVFATVGPDGFAAVAEDEPYRLRLLEGVRGRPVSFGLRSCAAISSVRGLGLDGWEYEYAGEKARFALPGRYNMRNALAAIAVCEAMGASPAHVREGLASVRPLFGRSEIVRGPVTVVQDCYNANLESALAALEFCGDVDWPGRKVYVLGSMKELGASAGAAHAALGEAAAASGADALFFYGEEARGAMEAAAAAGYRGALFHRDDYDGLAAAALAFVRDGDLVLLKASRSMALERLGSAITGRNADVS